MNTNNTLDRSGWIRRTILLLAALGLLRPPICPAQEADWNHQPPLEKRPVVVHALRPSIRRLDELSPDNTVVVAPSTLERENFPSTIADLPIPMRTGPTQASALSTDRTHPGAWWTTKISEPLRRPENKLRVSINALLIGALAHSARIRVISDEPLISEVDITTADAAFDWTAFFDTRWDDISEPVGSTLTTGGPERLRDHNATFELGARRRNTLGGEFEIGQKYGYQDNNSLFFLPTDQGTARLTLSYTQPLLRNSGRVYNTSLTVLAQLKTNVAQREFERQLQDHLLDITQAYWKLYFERGKLLQDQKLLASGIDILRELEVRQAIDALESQIVRARAAVENRRAKLYRTQLSIRKAEARIRALVNDPSLGETSFVELIPVEPLSEIPFPVELSSAVSLAMQQRPEIDAALQQIKAGCVRMNMSKNETLPLLNLVVETYVMGLEGNSNIKRAFTDQFAEGEPSYGVGLQYEYPIWNRNAKSRLQKRRLEVMRLQHQLRSTMEMLKLEVEESIHEVNGTWDSLPAKRSAARAAEMEVEYLTSRWELLPTDNGSASLLLEDLLDAQDRRNDAEQALLESSLAYVLSQVAYKRAVGGLLNQHNLSTARDCVCELPRQPVYQMEATTSIGTSVGFEPVLPVDAIPTRQEEAFVPDIDTNALPQPAPSPPAPTDQQVPDTRPWH